MMSQREVILEPDWWSKYSFKDSPAIWQNPHMQYIWDHAPPDRRNVGKMAIGILKEFNIMKKQPQAGQLFGMMKSVGITESKLKKMINDEVNKRGA